MEETPGCIAAVEEAVKPAVVAAAGLAGYATLHDGLYSTAVVSATAAAVILAREGAFERAVEYVRRAAEAAYEAAREIFQKAKVTLQRLYELFVEAIARALDYVRAHWFIIAAAGLISWLAAQQLDYTLWQDHVAKFAPLIAGVPAFKEFKTALGDSAPELLKAAEEALKYRSEGAVERLFEEARGAVGKSSKPWPDLRKAARNVEMFGKRVIKPEHAAVAWALLEAGLKELSGVKDKALSTLKEAMDKLSKEGETEISAKEISEFVKRAHDIAHHLELLFEQITENAEKYGKAEEIRRAFTVTGVAEELAEAPKTDFDRLGDATLADKVIAFFESLAEGTSWSRVVLNAMERGEAYVALIRTPRSATVKYGVKAEGGARDRAKRLGTLIARLAHWLAERGVDKAVIRCEGNTVKIMVNGEIVAEVETRAIKEEEERIVYRVRGKWAEEEGEKAKELAAEMEPGRAEDYELRALLVTDGGYEVEGDVYAATTSVAQAALYKRFGMKVSYAGVGNLAEEGFKPLLEARLYEKRGGKKVVEMIRRDLEDGLKALLGDAKLREELKEKALRLLGEIEISVHDADKETEEGRQRVEEARRKIEERIVKFLTELRLGENGSVCLANCQFGEPTLTPKHEPYTRVIAPLIHYIASEAPEEEIAKFLAYAVLFDGSVRRDRVTLALGNFRVDDASKRLPLDIYDKVALYIILAAKYSVGIKGVYVRKGEARIYFNTEHATKMFATAWGNLCALWRFSRESGLYADHVFKKLEGIRKYVESYVDKVRIEHILRGDKVTVVFKDERGDEIAHINIRWDGESLHANFEGMRKRAEQLVSILSAMGAKVKVKEYSGKWRIELTTDSITAIRRKEWLDAVRTLIEELHNKDIINKRQRERLLNEISAGPNVVEIAGVELSVMEIRTEKRRGLIIIYHPRSANTFDTAMKTLRRAGFVEGVHFTAKRPQGGKYGHVYIKIPAGLWKLEELKRQGVEWAKRALKRLEEIAKARGFYDLLEGYLKPAREAETVDPRGLVVEDAEKGIRAVIRDVKVVREGNRSMVVVEYETSGEVKSFKFAWNVVTTSGAVIASIRLNEEKAIVLVALTGDETIKKKRGSVQLSAKHLFALARLRGIGWELLRWYTEVMSEKWRDNGKNPSNHLASKGE
ncbi:paREP2b [Pyrobaculum aerophilum str. IM2]|uniref:PaREP2b n=2 Tax=Pyrobaculum aerophilum TaxID=13773 RepID=Q8ZWY1_PYRAE|nr:PaRep2b protein [Pyrobaculum aerophilum]AAL63568.1 paREP2b [Pyrobaculum aerophilum str. IM2]